MKTETEIRKRMADFKLRFDAEYEAAHAPGVKYEDHKLNLEMLGSWLGALLWVLGEEK